MGHCADYECETQRRFKNRDLLSEKRSLRSGGCVLTVSSILARLHSLGWEEDLENMKRIFYHHLRKDARTTLPKPLTEKGKIKVTSTSIYPD